MKKILVLFISLFLISANAESPLTNEQARCAEYTAILTLVELKSVAERSEGKMPTDLYIDKIGINWIDDEGSGWTSEDLSGVSSVLSLTIKSRNNVDWESFSQPTYLSSIGGSCRHKLPDLPQISVSQSAGSSTCVFEKTKK
ncbi:hypothetical protein OAQ84_01590 [Bdellovibrionales bacterium]|nr:hypothetical protein [Bdellovibrionales bacterium]